MPFILIIVLVCILPSILNIIGADFGTYQAPFDASAATGFSAAELIDAMHHSLAGSFSHTIFEWSAFCTAIFTVILSFVHFRITGEIVTPIIGVALFFAGVMDAFHTLAADRLIEAVADHHNLIPFTWAICRLFNALIMIVGVSMFLLLKREMKKEDMNKKLSFVIVTSLIFGAVAYLIIHYCATTHNLPETMFPDSLIHRPYDAAPLILFVFAGVYLFPKFYKKQPSVFSHALIISVIPQITTQAQMVFGSKALFDNSFNIAHFIKILAYFVPFIGLLLDYIYTYQKERQTIEKLGRTQSRLLFQTRKLMQSNKELKDFTLVASHDLQEPLRKIQTFGDRLQLKCGAELSDKGKDYIERMQNASSRMQALINDLLTFSRITSKARPFSKADLNVVVKEVLADLEIQASHANAQIEVGTLPVLDSDKLQMRQLFQNLISNALKFRTEGRAPVIRISGEIFYGSLLNGTTEKEYARIFVQDNGIGFDEKYSENIFNVFQRLHGRDEFEGTGIGLAICRKIVERHGGSITAKSVPGEGSTFIITLPLEQVQQGGANE